MNTVASVLKAMPSVERVRELEAELIKQPQVDLSTTHVVHGGMCARTIFIPAGTVLTGALTNCDNICIIHGDITVTTDEGTKRLEGFNVLPAQAGFKRAGWTHADTHWTTVFATEKTEIADIEREMTDEDYMLQTQRDGITYFKVAKAIEVTDDFDLFLKELNINVEMMNAMMQYTGDLVVTDECLIHLEKRASSIHGTGVFARHNLHEGMRIAPAQTNQMRAVAGRFTNHSPDPNAYFLKTDEGIDMHALRDIEMGEEITINYRQAASVNTAAHLFQGETI